MKENTATTQKRVLLIALAFIPLIASPAAADGKVTATITFGAGTISGSGTSNADPTWTQPATVSVTIFQVGGGTVYLAAGTIDPKKGNSYTFSRAVPAGSYAVFVTQNFTSADTKTTVTISGPAGGGTVTAP